MSVRLRSERGVGLIELLIALTILQIAIFAVFAMLNAGGLAILRASRVSAATAVGEKQMELYRGLLHRDIGLSATEVALAATDSTHTSETAEWSGPASQLSPTLPSLWCATSRPECAPVQTRPGPDNRQYRVDSYVRTDTVLSGRDVKRVTVVVRRADDLTRPPLARLSASFDLATGCIRNDPTGNHPC